MSYTNLRYNGLVTTTGSKDSGKTTFNLQVAPLKQIAFFHSDVKYPGVPKEEFGLFCDLQEMADGKALFGFREAFLKFIDKIPNGKYPVWIFDTWTRLGEAARTYVISHANQFREKEAFIMTHDPKMVGAQKWRDAHEYEANFISSLYRKTGGGYLGLIIHTKDDTQAGAKTGKAIPDSGKALEQASNFRVWLIRNGRALPTVVTTKRMTEAKVVNGVYQPTNILPDRFDCQEQDKSIWDAIDRYRKEPVGNRQPREEERPNEYELSIIQNTLTREQKEIWKFNLEEKRRQDAVEMSLVSQEEVAISDFIHSLNGSPLPIIKSKLEQQAKTEGWQQQEFSLGWIAGIIGG